ncbi:MAG: ABC transporter permease [Bacteroidota bacterium]|nr:ABC transporter permease [Bacteroidota bacterium]
MLYSSLQAEWKKSRHTFASTLIFSGAFLVPVVSFLIYFFRWQHFIPDHGTNAWNEFIDMNLSLSAGLLFPFLVILIVALNLMLENKADSWKRLYILPIRRETLFWGKLLFLAIQLFCCTVLFFITIPLTGIILGLIHPELAFLNHSLDIVFLLTLSIRFYISLLAILSIQYFISLAFSNIIVPIATGMMLIIVSIIVVQGWNQAYYDPYAFSILLSREDMVDIPTWFGRPRTELLSIGYFSLISLGAMVYFKQKQVK